MAAISKPFGHPKFWGWPNYWAHPRRLIVPNVARHALVKHVLTHASAEPVSDNTWPSKVMCGPVFHPAAGDDGVPHGTMTPGWCP